MPSISPQPAYPLKQGPGFPAPKSPNQPPVPGKSSPGAKPLDSPAGGAAMGMTTMGIAGMMGRTQAYRVQTGDNLTSIARQHLPPNASPQNQTQYIENLKTLNKLGETGQIKTGQALLLPPPIMGMGQVGTALGMVGLFSQADPEKILALQEKTARKLESALADFDVETRLPQFQTSPPPAPKQSDLQWLSQLNTAKRHPGLNYRPTPNETALATALEEAIAWQQMVKQPTHLSRADLQYLPPEAQNALQNLMNQDTQADDLSALDLAKAGPDAVKTLITTLKQSGYAPHEQRLVQTLAQLSRNSALQNHHQQVFRFVDEADHMVKNVNLHQLPPEDLKTFQNNLKAVRQTLADPQLIHQNSWDVDLKEHTLLSLKPTDNTLKEYDLAQSAMQAEKARSTLRERFDFAPENPYNFKAIQTQAAQLKTAEDKLDFVENYLKAHFLHPGDGTKWSLSASLGERFGMAEDLFFGQPPPLSQLPDGRCLIDCEGFTKLSQILMDTVAPNHQSLPLFIPGHVMNGVVLEDKFYLFDNENRHDLNVSTEEIKRFKSLHEDYNSHWDDLNPFRQSEKMTRDQFPALYDYTDRYKNEERIGKRIQGDYLKTKNRNNIF